MRLFLKIFIGVIVLTVVALTLRTDETFIPSIAALKPNETLVMKYSACHSGCDRGTVKFQNDAATMNGHTLSLTPEEIRNLDLHFISANELSDDYFCSLRILISFKKTSALSFPMKKKPQQYPCLFADLRDSINPESLIYYFNETPDQIPFWRRSPKDRLVIIEN